VTPRPYSRPWGRGELASTPGTDFQILAMGRSPVAMARATDRVTALGGGVVLVDGERIAFELPLPVGGVMSREPLAAAPALHGRRLPARGPADLARSLGRQAAPGGLAEPTPALTRRVRTAGLSPPGASRIVSADL
jgi:Adenine deaminase C-terminal domain